MKNSSSQGFSLELTPARIILLGYLTVILTGALLLMLPVAAESGETTGFLKTLFTSTSAVCVTGLIVVNTAEHWSLFGQTVILILIQIGGLGFMTLSTIGFILLGKKISLKSRILIKEDIGALNLSGVLDLIKYVVGLTLGAEIIGAFSLYLNFRGQMEGLKALWYGIFHAVSAFNNAGFDIFGDSLEGFTADFGVNLTISGLIIVGGLGFIVAKELFSHFSADKASRAARTHISLHSKVVLAVTLFLLLTGTLVFFVLERTNPDTMAHLSAPHRMLASFFLSVTPRTAGFNTVPTGAHNINTLFFMITLMFIGASPCSTGGGVKTTTFAAVLSSIHSTLFERSSFNLFERSMPRDTVEKAIAIVFVALFLVIAVTFLLTLTEEAEFLDIFFESVSAFGTVGLSTGITGQLSAAGRVIIIITMLAGRVGPLTLILSLRETDTRETYHYPDEDIMLS